MRAGCGRNERYWRTYRNHFSTPDAGLLPRGAANRSTSTVPARLKKKNFHGWALVGHLPIVPGTFYTGASAIQSLRFDRSAWVPVGRGGSMRRFVSLAVLLFFTVPFGSSIVGCGHSAPTVFCNGGDSGPVVGQVKTITLSPTFAT